MKYAIANSLSQYQIKNNQGFLATYYVQYPQAMPSLKNKMP